MQPQILLPDTKCKRILRKSIHDGYMYTFTLQVIRGDAALCQLYQPINEAFDQCKGDANDLSKLIEAIAPFLRQAAAQPNAQPGVSGVTPVVLGQGVAVSPR